MRCFRIYTERLNENKIRELLAISFDGFTILRTTGYWKGKKENSLIIEVMTRNGRLIKAIGDAIKKQNNQEAVLITSHFVDCELI